MTNSDDDILAGELAKVAKVGAARAGGAAASGAGLGARLTAKFLPTETYTEKLALKIEPQEALKLGFSVLTKLGKLQTEIDTKPSYPMLMAIVGSGFLNMNPAIVYLEILEGNSAGCELTITAAAKEGLIKQHTASKAVKRVVSGLIEIANRT